LHGPVRHQGGPPRPTGVPHLQEVHIQAQRAVQVRQGVHPTAPDVHPTAQAARPEVRQAEALLQEAVHPLTTGVLHRLLLAAVRIPETEAVPTPEAEAAEVHIPEEAAGAEEALRPEEAGAEARVQDRHKHTNIKQS